jgi:hypothetical protein
LHTEDEAALIKTSYCYTSFAAVITQKINDLLFDFWCHPLTVIAIAIFTVLSAIKVVIVMQLGWI